MEQRHTFRTIWIYAALGSLLVTGCTKEAKKNRALSRAENYFKAGEYDKAKIEYSNVLQVDPQNPAAIRQIGLIWAEQGAPLRALEFLAKARQLEPDNPEVHLKTAQMLLALRQLADARKEALTTLQKSPRNREAIMLLVDTSRSEQEQQETLRIAEASGDSNSAVPHLVAANLALRNRDLDGAQSALEKAIAAEPGSPQPQIAQGNLLLIRGKIDQATAAYRKAAELSRPRSAERLRYAEMLAQTRHLAEAEASVEGITKEAPDYLPAWNFRAQLALTRGKPEQAFAHLKNVFARDGSNFDARLLEGQAYLASGDAKKAIERFESLAKAFPKVPLLSQALARAYLKSGDTAKAIKTLSEAISSNPDDVEAILLLASLDLRSGNFQPAIDSLLALLKKQPELSRAQLLLSEAYRSAGRLAESETLLLKRIAANPEDSKSLLLLGLVQKQQGKTGEARASFEKADSLTPDSLLPLSQLVEMDLVEKRFDNALQKIDAKLENEPKLAGAVFLRGCVFQAQKDWKQAETEFKKSIELDPNLLGGYQRLSAVYVEAGELPQAIDRLTQLLNKDPANQQALILSAMAYERLNQFDKAKDAYERILQAHPEFVPALNNLAWITSENLNDVPTALGLARKARNLQPADPSVADTLGWILYRSGQYQQALALLREAAAADRDLPAISYHLGMAAYTMGEKELARTAFQKAANSTVDFSGKDSIPKQLALLEDGPAKQTLSVEELKKLVQSAPADTVAWIKLGEALEASGSTSDALAAYEKAHSINPKMLSPHLHLARLYLTALNDKPKAMEFARSARELAPTDSSVAGLAGHIALLGGNTSWAFGLLDDAAKSPEAGSGVLYDLGIAAYSLGRVKAASDAMKRTVAAAPDAPEAIKARKFLRFLPEDDRTSPASVEEAEAVLRQESAFVPALVIRAENQVKRGDIDQALATYNEVLRQYPAFAPAQKALAKIYADRPDAREKAYTLAVEARKTLADDAELTKILGKINFQRGDFAYAAQLLESVGKQSPLDAKELYVLGMSQMKSNAAAAGKENLRAALAAALAEPMATEAKRALEEASK